MLEPLRNQRDNPNEELLKKMGWDKKALNDFVDSWDEMRSAAAAGDVKAQNALKRRLESLGIQPNEKRRAVTGNEEEAGVLNTSGAVNEAPADERFNFNSFLQDLQRTRP